MRLRTGEAVKLALKALRNLEECEIRDISFEQFGTKLSIHCRYLWEKQSAMKYVKLNFFVVEQFGMEHRLSQIMIENPDQIGSGLLEIGSAHLDEEFHPSPTLAGFLRLHFFFGNAGRGIEIVFRELEISHEARLPESAQTFCRHEIE